MPLASCMILASLAWPIHLGFLIYKIKVIVIVTIFLKKRFYLFIHERHTQREAETQTEGKIGSLWGAWCGSRSQDLGWLEQKADAQPLRHPGDPQRTSLKEVLSFSNVKVLKIIVKLDTVSFLYVYIKYGKYFRIDKWPTVFCKSQ